MTDDDGTTRTCVFCGSELSDSNGDRDGPQFCSQGCRTVHATLVENGEGSIDESQSEADRTAADEHQSEQPTRTFLRISGMHNTTCEQFLESVARTQEGVADAEASYVSETIRVDYDPRAISEGDLCEVLTTTGYTAVPREEAPISRWAAAERGERRLESFIDFRYAAGVVFGSFLLLIYVTVLYPAYLSSLLGPGVLDIFADAAGFTGPGSFFVARLFLGVTAIVLLVTGLPLFRGAYVSLKMGQVTTEVLVALSVCSAFLYSTVAVIRGNPNLYFDFAIVVTTLVVGAMFYESVVKRRAADALKDLTVTQLEEARRLNDDGATTTISIDEVTAGDRILVRQGERIPVDGTLATGGCAVDESVITGESRPVVKESGDEVVAGSVVTSDAAELTVTDQATSSIDSLLESVWDIQSADHGVKRQANRLARIAVPICTLAITIGLVRLVLGAGPLDAGMTSLLVLLVGLPWGLGLATPLSVATSLAEALRNGIVIFDETVFERLRGTDTIVFDKTGTLTTGTMQIVEADAPDDLLEAVARLEERAAHPAAVAIADRFGARIDGPRGDDEMRQTAASTAGEVEEFTSHSEGVAGTIDGESVLVGTIGLFEKQGWTVDEEIRAKTRSVRDTDQLPVVVGREGTAEGIVVMQDEPRSQHEEVFSRLGEQAVESIVLTGDDEAAAKRFESHPDVHYVFANVPPSGKTETIRQLQATRDVTMVGDGTNDAPALAQADLGISLGGGTALASDAADITILEDNLEVVPQVFGLAERARNRVKQNTGLALLYNGFVIPLAVAGVVNPVLVMVGVLGTAACIGVNSARSLLN